MWQNMNSKQIKAVQYSPDGKLYQYDLDLGAITRTVEETVKRYGWKFEFVLSRDQASYTPNLVQSLVSPPPAASYVNPQATGYARDAAPSRARGNKPSGIGTAFFWLAWAILALLSGLMLLAGFSLVRLAGFGVLVALPLLTKKLLFKKFLPSLMQFVAIFVVFGIIVTMTNGTVTPAGSRQ